MDSADVKVSKWYDIHISAPHGQPPEDGWGIKSRDELPAYKEICARRFELGDYKPEDVALSASGPGWASAVVGGGDADSYVGFRDFPDYREAQIRTHRHAEIEEIGKMGGVTVKEVPSSNIYMLSGIIWNFEEAQQATKLQNEKGRDGDREYMNELFRKFDEVLWPNVRSVALAMIAAHISIDFDDSTAVLHDLKSKSADVVFFRTNSLDLIKNLRELDSHVTVQESPPGTTLADVERIVKKWSEPRVPKPSVPVSGEALPPPAP